MSEFRLGSLTSGAARQARRCLSMAGFRESCVRDDFSVGKLGTVPLLAFGHTPFDARSASIAFLEGDIYTREAVSECRDLGAHVYCVHTPGHWEIWKQAAEAPQLQRQIKEEQLDNFFARYRDVLNPTAIYRAKIDRTLTSERQREFVAFDLLPRIEEKNGAYLVDVFARMVVACADRLRWEGGPPNEGEAVWLIRSNFWLLAAKMLHDKRVPRFINNFDPLDVAEVFDRVDTHYSADIRSDARGRLPALRSAAAIMADTYSLRGITTETLGALFEESLIDDLTRKKYGTHRTPTYLVDYILAKLADPLGELIKGKDAQWLHQNLHILEPACGHAPFLTGMVGWLNALLPVEITANDGQRRTFLRKNLHGIEADYFAYEVARLSLTVADIPNPNGWSLINGDMFSGPLLSESAAKAHLVISNPPFEAESLSSDADPNDLRNFRKAAEVVRRTVQAMPPGGLFGFVLPQAFLDSPKARDLRRWMIEHCDMFEIGTYPPNMFQFAKPEVTILLGKIAARKKTDRPLVYRRINAKDRKRFELNWASSSEIKIPAQMVEKRTSASFLFAELDTVWASLSHLPRFGDYVSFAHGFQHYESSDPRFSAPQLLFSDKSGKGFEEGYYNLSDDPLTHLHPRLRWVNRNSQVLRERGGVLGPPMPQVLLNYGRTGGSHWRHKPFIDNVGRYATSSFVTARPNATTISLPLIWALACSPVANAFTYTHRTGRVIAVRLWRELRVPDLTTCNTNALEHAVAKYFREAIAFSACFGVDNGIRYDDIHAKAVRVIEGIDPPDLTGLAEQFDARAFLAASDHLRALHWRVDAEVLKLYSLPLERERELLDFFIDVPRAGVPFVQKKGKEGYIPRDFREVKTLDEFLRITDEWDATNGERFALIEKKIAKQATRAELRRLVQLQRLLGVRQDFYTPLPLRELDADLARLEARFGSLDDGTTHEFRTSL